MPSSTFLPPGYFCTYTASHFNLIYQRTQDLCYCMWVVSCRPTPSIQCMYKELAYIKLPVHNNKDPGEYVYVENTGCIITEKTGREVDCISQ